MEPERFSDSDVDIINNWLDIRTLRDKLICSLQATITTFRPYKNGHFTHYSIRKFPILFLVNIN
jgi:hypothetical protein